MTPEQQKMVADKLYTRQPAGEPPVRFSELLEVIAQDYEQTASQRRETYGSGDCIAGVWDAAAVKLREKIRGINMTSNIRS